LQTSLRVKKSNFDSLASDFATVSAEAIHSVCERINQGDYNTAYNDDERSVLNLMRQVKVITAQVPGSASSKIVMRNEIRSLIMTHGLPSFYITINPADVYNPIV
ncbi:hypothetical protein K474DRAFT_1568304, partial [Panus rudis PR-1116 ss-1]